MENLPYLLKLIKTNALLYSIISTGGFSHIDLKNEDHYVWTQRTLELKNFALSETDVFTSVMIKLNSDTSVVVELRTMDPRYFDNSQYYFEKDTVVQKQNPYFINDSEVNVDCKILGEFPLFDPPVTISLRHSSIYDYLISLNFRKRGTVEPQIVPDFWVQNYPSTQNIVTLFKPGEIKLKKEYRSVSNIPTIRILVKNKNHPILKYYKNKASLLYQGKLYNPDQIPLINPDKIKAIRYHDKEQYMEGKLKQGPVLEVLSNEQPQRSKQGTYDKRLSYRTEPLKVKYYELEGTLMTKKDLRTNRIKLNAGYKLQRIVFGKEAADTYGDQKYSMGVAVYIKVK